MSGAVSFARLLRDGLDNNEFEPVYQPVLDLRNGRLLGWEALVRWHSKELGLVMPSRFLALAEREGLMPALSDRVLRESIAMMAYWQRTQSSLSNCFLSVNLSVADLSDVGFPDRLEWLCNKEGLALSCLRVEIAESAIRWEDAQFADIATRLQLKGFRLAIDDFGAAGFSQPPLDRLPFSSLKIDRSLVVEMTNSEEAVVSVAAILNLAQTANLEVIAEGVDNPTAALWLRDAGCRLAQGYHFARPMPAQDVPGWAEARRRAIAA